MPQAKTDCSGLWSQQHSFRMLPGWPRSPRFGCNGLGHSQPDLETKHPHGFALPQRDFSTLVNFLNLFDSFPNEDQ